jgi:quercetin dioxygenase-like cupin family protein
MQQEATYTKVSWDGLKDYPGETSRIYSGPLRCENLAFIINRQEPGSAGVHHSHEQAEEIYVVIRGAGQMRIGDETIDVKELDGIRVPAGVEHSTANPTDADCWWLVMGSPPDEFIAWDPVAYGPGGA